MISHHPEVLRIMPLGDDLPCEAIQKHMSSDLQGGRHYLSIFLWGFFWGI